MEEVENLVKTTLGEIEKMLSTKTVVGDPVNLEGRTIIPLLTVGFGFGAGGGSGKGEMKQKAEGVGLGTGGGGWVKPIAIAIIDKDGVRLEAIKGGMSEALAKLIETLPEMAARCRGWKEEEKK